MRGLKEIVKIWPFLSLKLFSIWIKPGDLAIQMANEL